MDDKILFTHGFEIKFPVIQKAHNVWTDIQVKGLRYYLIKFVANVRNGKTWNDFMPTTLKQYILIIQRALSTHRALTFYYFRAQFWLVLRKNIWLLLITAYVLYRKRACTLKAIMFYLPLI